jgi:protocatechuate 3,4-dioxygenase alpha subunit
MSLPLTPSQTAGPYHTLGLTWPDGPSVVGAGTPGAVWLRGRLFDGRGDPISDGLIETWQADPDGRFDQTGSGLFRGFGRCATGPDGGYAILTLKPGPIPTAGIGLDRQAPHIDVSVFARGMLKRAVTRIYFADEADANAADPVLAGIADPAARASLVAEVTDDGYRFDIRLQGDGETVFFDI